MHAVRTNHYVIALHNLVAAEQQRFPELGQARQGHGPEGHHPAVSGALCTLADQGRLVIPDREAAIIWHPHRQLPHGPPHHQRH
ncbi:MULTISPECIES: TetR/AcrR family transcriptional regulator C-terminal domain-containing protein [unclassified Streptomyces]|uniref:TetR/AcrR family transcriptional regulator C-terminal domain-containing protein n=1 Tax=unclassified Streptomyces TaxID=2593676 RepID=UPI002DD933C0|nr:TetR/AcrR family transcriptional regulator C-terminal domain-containing protein [Streptomyces sp. NBC_00243]WRZ18034.1 TetR/AcrR family transcriptional regulator C-terminal domain-containing protein [Streptomyces sp. NBC_00243]